MNQNTESPFKTYFDQTLERCGFDDDLKAGMLFFLGESIIAANTNQLMNMFVEEEKIQQEFRRLFTLYASSSAEINPFEALDIEPIKQIIYTYNEIYVNKIRNKSFDFESIINDNLKSTFKLDFIEKFEGKTYKLITNHNLNTSFFKQIGAYLNQFELSHEDIYLAGITYYQTHQKIDFEGINLLNLNIIDSFSPLYTTLFHYPLLYTYYPANLNANHLFSSILQFLYLHTNTDIAKHIHAFHNHIFYENNPRRIRKGWEFEEVERGVLISQTLHNALNIRKSPIFTTRPDFLASDNYLMKELKDQNIPLDNFKALISKTIEEYYETNLDEVVKGKLNHAEFLQLLAIIFYETAANAMIIKSWKN
ncbi:hypothetical protein HX088_08190 [Empedobacter sp. 225-1]|uniref:hypothetical protein n=1 Tax=unclassified Empedobacter TaxID=2643773 RepID=UPI002575309F|nr:MULTISPECIES: hypothetical protein [unclassified Empedobacter]MDM1523247.1 hypothetical protein [Empedobacter sp. 225-1]MDM1542494.1 hypothetical protein [Empedobacter sp. 189-2]